MLAWGRFYIMRKIENVQISRWKENWWKSRDLGNTELLRWPFSTKGVFWRDYEEKETLNIRV